MTKSRYRYARLTGPDSSPAGADSAADAVPDVSAAPTGTTAAAAAAEYPSTRRRDSALQDKDCAGMSSDMLPPGKELRLVALAGARSTTPPILDFCRPQIGALRRDPGTTRPRSRRPRRSPRGAAFPDGRRGRRTAGT